MAGIFIGVYLFLLGFLVFLTKIEAIPSITVSEPEKLWALILAPIFFFIYMAVYFFTKDES